MKSIHYTAIAYLMVSAFNMHAMGTSQLITQEGHEGCQLTFPTDVNSNNNNNNNNQITGKKRAAEDEDEQEAEELTYEQQADKLTHYHSNVADIVKCVTSSLWYAIETDFGTYQADLPANNPIFAWLKKKTLAKYSVNYIMASHMADCLADRAANYKPLLSQITKAETPVDVAKEILQTSIISQDIRTKLQQMVSTSKYNEKYANALATKILTRKTQFMLPEIAQSIESGIEEAIFPCTQTGFDIWFQSKLKKDIAMTYAKSNAARMDYVEPYLIDGNHVNITTLTNKERNALAPAAVDPEDATAETE